jgi:hypothetical protein
MAAVDKFKGYQQKLGISPAAPSKPYSLKRWQVV